MIIADDGFFFGIGAFETIAVKDGVPILLSHHYDRLLNTLKFLNLTNISMDEIKREVKNTLENQDMHLFPPGQIHTVKKIMKKDLLQIIPLFGAMKPLL